MPPLTCNGGARAPCAPAPWLRHWWPILPSVRKEMICYFFRTCTDHWAPCSLFCNYMPLNTFVPVGRPPSILLPPSRLASSWLLGTLLVTC